MFVEQHLNKRKKKGNDKYRHKNSHSVVFPYNNFTLTYIHFQKTYPNFNITLKLASN